MNNENFKLLDKTKKTANYIKNSHKHINVIIKTDKNVKVKS